MSGIRNIIPRKAACSEKQQIAAAGGSGAALKEFCRPLPVVCIQSPVGTVLVNIGYFDGHFDCDNGLS